MEVPAQARGSAVGRKSHIMSTYSASLNAFIQNSVCLPWGFLIQISGKNCGLPGQAFLLCKGPWVFFFGGGGAVVWERCHKEISPQMYVPRIPSEKSWYCIGTNQVNMYSQKEPALAIARPSEKIFCVPPFPPSFSEATGSFRADRSSDTIETHIRIVIPDLALNLWNPKQRLLVGAFCLTTDVSMAQGMPA